MRSALMMLSAAALFVSFFSSPPSAEARGGARSKDGAHRTYAGRERSGMARRAVRMGSMTSAKRPGGCGTFMYWKDGKCNDARNKK
jgi:hypothetical protein